MAQIGDALDVLVKLAFDANEAGLAEVNKFLIQESNIVKELENKITSLNKTISDGSQRSVQDNVKLVNELNKTRSQYDHITTSIQDNQKAIEASSRAAITAAAVAKKNADEALGDMNRQIAIAKELGRTQLQNAVARPGDGVIANDPARAKLFVARVNEQSIAMRNAAIATRNYQASLDQLSRTTNTATQANVNLGRIIQDAPFGFLGVTNNLNPMLEGFQRLTKETGSTGAAFKAMGASLIGAGGLGIAVSIVSSLLVVYGDKLFSSSKAADEAKKSADELTKSLVSEAEAYAKLVTADNEYLRGLQLETDLIKAKGVVRDQLSKSENENLQQEGKETQKKNDQLFAQKQVLKDMSDIIRSKPIGVTLADYLNSAAFSLDRFNSYTAKYRDVGFLQSISKDLKSIEKDGGDVVQELYKKINELDGQAESNNNRVIVSRAETAAKTADRQFQTAKSLNADIFNLEKELIDKRAAQKEKENADDIRSQEAQILTTQAASLRELELQQDIARKQNSSQLRITIEGEQAKTGALITEQQKRIASLKAVSDGGVTSQLNINAEESQLAILKKNFEDNEKITNGFREQDASNEGLFARKRMLINQIAAEEIARLRGDMNKKIREATLKFYDDVEGLEKSQLARELSLYQKEDTDTMNVRMRILQNDAEETQRATAKKYEDLFKIAEKYGIDTTNLQKAYNKEQEINSNEERLKQLDALEAYYQDRINIITRQSGLEASKLKSTNRNNPNLPILLAQNDLVTSKSELAQAQENYNRVLDDSTLSEEQWSVAAEKAEKRVIDAQIKASDAQDALTKKRIDAIQGQINQYNNLVQTIGGAALSIIDIEKARTEALITEQQRRVDAVNNIVNEGNAVLLKAEQDRLDALINKQRKYEREQRAINAALVISQNLVNIAKAVGAVIEAGEKGAKDGGLPGLIISVVGALAVIAAGIASSVSAVKSVNTTSGYKKGGYTGDGNEHDEAGPVHKREYVFDAKSTKRLGKDTLEGLRKGRKRVVDVDYQGMNKDISFVRQNEFGRSNDFSELKKELHGVKKAIQDKPVSRMYADARGFTEHVIGEVNEINKYKNL